MGFDTEKRVCHLGPVQPVMSDAQVNSAEFWKQPFRVPASSDPDEATAQTIRIMCGHIKDGAGDQAVRSAASEAAARFGGLAGLTASGDERVAGACWQWCKTFIKFVHHEFIIRQKLGEAGHLQGLISPEVLVRMEKPEGDCAIFTECLCAFLRVLGIPYEIVTVAVNPNEPDIFSHVYLYAVMPDGSRLPLDVSHGDYPGWQVPSAHVSRRQVWDADGHPVADRGSRFDGLHNYGLRGLGDFCDDYPDECGQSGPSSSPSSTTLPYYDATQVFAPGSTPTPYSGPTYTAPSQSNSAQWASFAAQLAKQGFTLAQINAIQPGTVVGANGTILRQSPGFAVPVGTGIQSTLNNLGSGNSMLYLGLGAVVLLLMVKK